MDFSLANWPGRSTLTACRALFPQHPALTTQPAKEATVAMTNLAPFGARCNLPAQAHWFNLSTKEQEA